MNKKFKNAFVVAGLTIFAFALSSCNSFCEDVDIAHFAYAYDPINTRYFDSEEDAKDYIVTELKTYEEINKKESFDITELKVYKENSEGTKRELQNVVTSDLIGTYGNLNYIKPIEVYYTYTTTVDDNTVENTISYFFGVSSFTKSLIDTCIANNIYVPSYEYWEKLDQKLMDKMLANVNEYSWLSSLTKDNITFKDVYGYTYEQYKDYVNDPTSEKLQEMLGEDDGKGNPTEDGFGRNYSLLTSLGYKKYSMEGETDKWSQIEVWNKEIIDEGVFEDQAMSDNFLKTYKSNIDSKVNNIKTCITVEDGFYGHTSDNLLDDTVRISGKASDFWAGWGNAFAKHGFLEGLLVYPISYLVETFSHAFGMNGYGQIFAVLLVTLIVRLLFMAISLPSTLSQQKMQLLQPEIAKLQQKYPNYSTNTYEKQKFAEAQSALYKKYKIKPFMSLIIMVFQFPIFICVWNAMQGSASLSSDAVLGLRLSDTIWGTLTKVSGWPGIPGWWTALVLILLMSSAQIVAMLVPGWLNKRRMKKVTKTGVAKSANDQQRTTKFVQWFLTIFIIIMGFTLPSAMGVYWFAGAVFSTLQSLIMHFILIKREGRK